jgi:predicted DNA-binding protein (MmcQ/YjbR family)
MTLHDPQQFQAHLAAWPGVELVEQWGNLVAKVGRKVFGLIGDADGSIAFKVSELAFDGLVELPGIAQAPYFAKRMWVRVEPGALDEQLLAGYIAQSYETVAASLTKKLRAELGISS